MVTKAAKQVAKPIPCCPACVDEKGKPLQCTIEINMTHVRYSCPRGRKCATGGFYVDDYDSQMKPVDEAFKATLDAPSDHRLQDPGIVL